VGTLDDCASRIFPYNAAPIKNTLDRPFSERIEKSVGEATGVALAEPDARRFPQRLDKLFGIGRFPVPGMHNRHVAHAKTAYKVQLRTRSYWRRDPRNREEYKRSRSQA